MQNEQCYEKLRLPLNTLKYIEVLIEDVNRVVWNNSR